MSITHLPVLQVIIPLIFAPICIMIRHVKVTWIVTCVVAWVSFGISCVLLNEVLTTNVISYAIGGWLAPWGIEYRLDIVNAFVLIIVSGIGAIVATFARDSVLNEISEDRIYLFYTAFLLCLSGLLGVVITGDAFNMFVFIEIASLSSYALISIGKDRQALLAAYRYLIFGAIGATFILIGIGLLYVMTGTLNIVDIQARLPEVIHTRTIKTALAFFTIGIAIKSAMFPLHIWLPAAYTYAPSTVSAFLAGTTTKVFIYVLLRFLFTIFGAEFVFEEMNLDIIFLLIALLAIFSGSIAAIYQENVKRMLAYSSVAQIGYMVLGISLVSVTGLTAGILHLFNHAIIKTTLFMGIAAVVYRLDSATLSDMKGIGKSMPWTMAAFVLAGLSLIGIPATVGFISKWYLILAALEQGLWLVAVAILLGSLLAMIYIWRIVEVAYFQEPAIDGSGKAVNKEAPLSMLIPLWVIVLANIYFGINASLTSGVAMQAAEHLLGIN